MRPLEIVVPGQPPSVNERSGAHWTRRSKERKEWRTLAYLVTNTAIQGQGWTPPACDIKRDYWRFTYRHFVASFRGDPHNRIKTITDGIADALAEVMPGFNDSRVVGHDYPPLPAVAHHGELPCVVVEVGLDAGFWASWGGA